MLVLDLDVYGEEFYMNKQSLVYGSLEGEVNVDKHK